VAPVQSREWVAQELDDGEVELGGELVKFAAEQQVFEGAVDEEQPVGALVVAVGQGAQHADHWDDADSAGDHHQAGAGM
jgi:hypothetical protein